VHELRAAAVTGEVRDVYVDPDLSVRVETCCSAERPHVNEAPPPDGQAHWLRATVVTGMTEERRNIWDRGRARPTPIVGDVDVRVSVSVVGDEVVVSLPDVDDDDQLPLDYEPDQCWRCDAREAASAVGLCKRCHRDLAG
jgi:hypothetical protein